MHAPTATPAASPGYDPAQPTITPRIAAEVIYHEGIAREAYRDSVGVWTWSAGLTDACGHRVMRYRDHPQSLQRCLEVYVWVLANRYLPAVLRAFGTHAPAEHELAAALSFHWNTGAIDRAEWMALVRAGERGKARRAMLNWCRPAALAVRRKREQALFFDGRWAGDGTALIYSVAKPEYRPHRPERQPVMPALEVLLGNGRAVADEPVTEKCVIPADPVPSAAVPPASTHPAEEHGGNWFTRLFT